MKITKIYAREILDSRATPTVEAEVYLENGVVGTAKVPSGASTGIFEAIELRDGDKGRYNGKGVLKAVENVNTKINDAICGMCVFEQRLIDKELIKLDNTENKGNLGANAMLGVSLACADAAAKALNMSLYRYIGGVNSYRLPMPMMNILNGGAHADNNVDIQEFMIVPINAKAFKIALRQCCEVYYSLKDVIKKSGKSTGVGDEGGFAPNLSSDEEAFELICEAIKNAGYRAGEDFKIAIDAASSEWVQPDGKYKLPKSGVVKTADEMIDYWESLSKKYPICSIEDGMSEEDWEGFQKLSQRLSNIQLVGDDLFVTNTKRIKKGIQIKAGNSVLIKVNQIGTLTEAIEAVQMAQKAGYTAIISHRSGETEDTKIADIAVALNAGQIKTGAPARSERVAKYNRLLKIEEELSFGAEYGDIFMNN